MIWKKIFVLFSGLIISFFAITWQIGFGIETKPAVTEIKTQMPDVSPEVREKAFGLLKEVLAESENLKSSLNKLEIQFEIADLLWEKDEAKARNMFRSIFENEEICNCQNISIEKVAARDAKFAAQLQGSEIIFEYLVKQYPQDALNEAKKNLTGNSGGYFSPMVGNGILVKLNLIYSHNSQNGADFARAILTNLKENKLNVRYTDYNANYANRPSSLPANMANSSNMYLERKYPTNTKPKYYSNKPSNFPSANSNVNWNVKVNNVDFSEAREFFEMALSSKEPDQKGQTQKETRIDFKGNSLKVVARKGQTQMLTESELGELAKLMVGALIAAKKFNGWEVRGIYEPLKKYAPNEMAKLEKSLTPKRLREIKESSKLPSGIFSLPSIPSNSAVKEKIPVPPNETPVEKKEREFVDNVHYISSNYSHCNIEEDAIVFARFQNKSKYPDMVEYFMDYMPVATAKIGNIKELRKYVEKEPGNSEKIKLLSYAADAVTTPNDKNDLAELLKETKISIPQSYKNVTEFNVMLNYAKILAAASPSQSFDLLESLLKDADEIINSAAVVAEFTEDESQENGEFRFMKMREQIAKKSPLTIGMIKKMAHSDFERTKKLADKFTRPEVRLFIKWHIANSLLNKNAPTEEAKFYEVEICG